MACRLGKGMMSSVLPGNNFGLDMYLRYLLCETS
jgi:hypothetical protein